MYKEFKLTVYGILAFVIGFVFDQIAVYVAKTNLDAGSRISHVGINLVIALLLHYAMSTSKTIRNKMFFSVLIALCGGKVIEEILFNPYSWGISDVVFFMATIVYHIYKYKKLKSVSHFNENYKSKIS